MIFLQKEEPRFFFLRKSTKQLIMKKSLSPLFLLVSFSFLLCLVASTGCNSNSEAQLKAYVNEQDPLEIPSLLERSGELASATEWPKTKAKVDELKEKIASKPEDIKLRLQVAAIFINEQRVTGEHHYYYKAIEKILDGILSIDPKNFEATVFKASVKMSLHQFPEAKKIAEDARNINPNNAYVYGILVDANVELGNYEEAIAMSDKMQALRPSLEAYSRASYLREIYGDYNGAIAAMKLAVQAGLPGSEPQCWCRNILAELYFNTNQLKEAENTYRENLSLRPSYAPSMAGLAKLEAKNKNFSAAIALTDSANAIMPGVAYEEQKADIYQQMGDTKKAGEKFEEVKKLFEADAASGHSISLELARFFIKMNQFDSAQKYALQEYNIRPKNIEVNKELAWIAYSQKDIAKAKEYLKIALHTGSKNPELLKRAAVISKS